MDELSSLKNKVHRLELLYRVSNVIHSTLEPQEALDLILKEAVRITRGTSGSVVLINPTNGFMEIQAAHELPQEALDLRLRVGQGITGWVASNGKTARVNQVHQDPRYVQVRAHAQSELAVPLQVDGEIKGVLNVDSDQVDAFTEEDEELLQEFAFQACKVIQNTWLYEQLRSKARMFEALTHIGKTINSTLGLDDALRVVVQEANHLMRSKLCAVHLLDHSSQWLDLTCCSGAGDAYLAQPRLPIQESLLGVVVRRMKAIQIENVQTSGHYQNVSIAIQEGLVSLLSTPLIFSNQAIGTLSIYMDFGHTFSNEEKRVLSAFAELSAIAIEKVKLYERMMDAEELLRQNERLSSLGMLAAEVAHEIRNPLTVMKMLFHSLNLTFPAADPRAKDARIMGEKMDHLNRIVERVLGFAKNAEPKLGLVNINDLVSDLALLTRHKLSQQQVTLVQALEPTLPPIHADATQLEQAFLNLILNAIQAMPEGGQLTITTQSGQIVSEGGQARGTMSIEFKDTGEGMTVDQRDRAFTSLLSTGKSEGTGLGLTIVHRIIETHHGHLTLESSQGKGTSIRIVLPIDLELK